MKLTLATLTAAVTLAATSAFAVTTPEDQAFNAAFNAGHVAPIAEADYVKSQSPLMGRNGIADGNGYIFVSHVDNAEYDETTSLGRR